MKRLPMPRAVLLAALLLAACATPYQARDRAGFGYSMQQLSAGEYLVHFMGNTATGDEQLDDFTLLRAAQIATILGYPYLVVLDKDASDAHLQVEEAKSSNTIPPLNGNGGPTYATRGATEDRGREVVLHVRFLRVPTGAQGAKPQEVKQLVDKLSRKYGLTIGAQQATD